MARKSTGGVVEKQTSRGTSYGIRFRAGGKRRFVHVGYATEGWTRRRAEEELANVLADVRRGIWKPPSAPIVPKEEPTFHEFASAYFEAQKLEGGRRGKGLSAKGATDLEWRLTKHLLPAFARFKLSEITVEEVDKYRRRQVAEAERRRAALLAEEPLRDAHGRLLRPLSASSINKTITTLAAILERAVEYELIARNPASGRRRKLVEGQAKRTRLDRADHIVALLDAAAELDAAALVRQGQRRALLATLAFAGLRIGELLELRWRDVDLARGTLRVRHAKTDAGDRTVNLVPALRDELLSYRAGLGDVDRRAFVFPSSTGGRQSESNVRSRVLARAVEHANAKLEEAGEEPMPALTPHSLRRTFASLLVAIGEPPTYAMAQMGHTKAEFTLSVYASEMARRDGELARLKALVEGKEWEPTGTSGAEARETGRAPVAS
jgi:integrase